MRLVYSPAFGTRLDVHSLADAVGKPGDPRGFAVELFSSLVDVGDQDGDGRGDYATSEYVFLTRDAGPPVLGPYFGDLLPGWDMIADTLDDLDGDGRPELVVSRILQTPTGDGQSATYAVDVFDTGSLKPALPLPDVELPPVALPPVPPVAPPPLAPPPPPVISPPVARAASALVLQGTRGDDRLQGGPDGDRLFGRDGDDLLLGGPGDDEIHGGRGRDRIDAGPGDDRVRVRDGRRDRVRCGPGRDTVTADRVDRLIGCERRAR
jgi:Ca2+-binding RTX toxin-like protein